MVCGRAMVRAGPPLPFERINHRWTRVVAGVAVLSTGAIDQDAVRHVLAEVVHVPLDQLGGYGRDPGGDARRVLRDRTAVADELRETWTHPIVTSGDSRPHADIVLWSLEATPDGRWRLELPRGWHGPDWYELSYHRGARALVMEPPLDRARLDVVGVRRDRDDGTWVLGAKTGSVEEATSGAQMHGWRLSWDVREAAQRELRDRLDAPSGSPDRRVEHRRRPGTGPGRRRGCTWVSRGRRRSRCRGAGRCSPDARGTWHRARSA